MTGGSFFARMGVEQEIYGGLAHLMVNKTPFLV